MCYHVGASPASDSAALKARRKVQPDNAEVPFLSRNLVISRCGAVFRSPAWSEVWNFRNLFWLSKFSDHVFGVLVSDNLSRMKIYFYVFCN